MTEAAEVGAAQHVLRVVKGHPECLGGEVIEPVAGRPRLLILMNVEMPLHMKADGVSPTGVRTIEPVVLKLAADHPWSSPDVYLRDDFPRHFPHLHPSASSTLPRPCLIDGDQDEFFLQFGLVEYGMFQLVDQLAGWLRKAAIGRLMDPRQGWEPMLRRDFEAGVELDGEVARAAVSRGGGWLAWRAEFMRPGPIDARLGGGVGFVWITSKGVRAPLKAVLNDKTFAAERADDFVSGNTIVGLVWPDKLPSGGPHVSGEYMPEDVGTLADLRRRAGQLGCGRGFETLLVNLERRFSSIIKPTPVPVCIVLCARRPVHLIGSHSKIELLPYVVELRAEERRTSLFAAGDDEPVLPAYHFEALGEGLMRRMSAVPPRPALALLGCGSVGSKVAMHAVRSGQSIVAVSDRGRLRPHNVARHALGPTRLRVEKAEAMADELAHFGNRPQPWTGDIAVALRDPALRPSLIPAGAAVTINATASLAVREALIAASRERLRSRLLEAALFGRGRGAYLLAEGAKHNPNHSDLIAELYATLVDPIAAGLMHDAETGLTAVQVGQGCASLTMPMSDARLSAMAARLSEEIGLALDDGERDGRIVVGAVAPDGTSETWARRDVPAFKSVRVEGGGGWELRISKSVADRIRAEAKAWGDVETGGVLIGTSSARLGVVTVVDLLDAPADSRRTAGLFVLGTSGLQQAILDRHQRSGGTLYDVGTWHSHLADEGPSPTDWSTAGDLARERAPPSVLLITTPTRFHAIVASDDGG